MHARHDHDAPGRSTATILPGAAPLDIDPRDFGVEPFGLDLPWSAEALADAAHLQCQPLHRFDFAPSANDAAAHRPRRAALPYAPAAAAPPLFRVGG